MISGPEGWSRQPETGVQRWLEVMPPEGRLAPLEASKGGEITDGMRAAISGLFLIVAEVRISARRPVIVGINTIEIARALEEEGEPDMAWNWVELGETAMPWDGQPSKGTNRVFGPVQGTGVLYEV